MKTVRHLLMGFFLTLIVVGVVYAVYSAGRAVCCEVDLDVFQAQLTTATALNIGISTLLSRIKYRARGWRWFLNSIALTAGASGVWTITYWVARASGLASREATLMAYLISLASLGSTALLKIDEAEEPSPAGSKRKRRR